MTLWQMISIAFLLIMVALILWGVRGHKGSGDVDGGLDATGNAGADIAD